ncbi:hypothetical protein VTN00DRAFT_6807 [Thermoascus crustaceus]|uniref:uncharacterized protein n=1 Tax=Thermoascus crustaceus TaxID=5088 RepID=UPI0037420D51
MADILTQLQTCLDQLATQFYATLCYLTTYHDHSPATVPPNIPDAAPQLAKIPKNQHVPPVPASVADKVEQQQAQQAAQSKSSPSLGPGGGGGQGTSQSPPPTTNQQAQTAEPDPNLPPAPDSPRTFAARQRELARDLIIKEQQIEYLISVLPGIGSSEAEQEARIRELEGELRAVEEERERKARELRRLGRKLEKVLGAVERGVYGERDVGMQG